MQGRCPVALQLVKSHFDVAPSSPTANGRRATEKNVTLAVTSVPCVIKNRTLNQLKSAQICCGANFFTHSKRAADSFLPVIRTDAERWGRGSENRTFCGHIPKHIAWHCHLEGKKRIPVVCFVIFRPCSFAEGGTVQV